MLSASASGVLGGLLVLGSIHTEMTALLHDAQAPLYNHFGLEVLLVPIAVGAPRS